MGANGHLKQIKDHDEAATAGSGRSAAPFPFVVFGRDEMDTTARPVAAPPPDLSVFSAYARREEASPMGPRAELVRLLAEEHRRSEMRRSESTIGIEPRTPAPTSSTVLNPSRVSLPHDGSQAPVAGVAPIAETPMPGLRLAARDELPDLSKLFAPVVSSISSPAQELAPLLPIPGLSAPRKPSAPAPSPRSTIAVGEAVAPFARLSPPAPDSANLAPLVIPSAFGRSAAPFPLPSIPVPASSGAPRTNATASGSNRMRIALAVAALVAVAVGADFVLRRGWIFPRSPGPQALVGASVPVDGGKFGGPIAELPAVAENAPPIVAPPAKTIAAERPAPSPEFNRIVGGLKISGVLQGTPVVALVNGRKIRAGELVSVESDIRLVDADFAGRRLIFEDGTTARASARY